MINTQNMIAGAVGTDAVVALAIGAEIVWSSSPWEGLEIRPSSVSLSNESSAQTVVVKSSEYWEITTPAWLTATPLSGDSGETQVLLEATYTASTSGYVEAVSNNYSASASVEYEYIEPWVGLVVSPTAVSFSNTGVSSATLTVSASSEWTSFAPAWASVSPSTGTTGLTSVVLTMDTTYSASTTGQTLFDLDGLALTESVDIDYTYTEPAHVNYVPYVHSENMSDEQDDFIDTGVYPDFTTRGKLTGKLTQYHNSGPFLGFCDNDDQDWRLFCTSTEDWYMDVAYGRANTYLTNTGIYDDIEIEFGNCYWSASTGDYTYDSNTGGTLQSYPIKLDMGMMWITSLELWTDNVKVFDGHAAESAGTYGIYDEISGNFLLSENDDFNMVAESAFSGNIVILEDMLIEDFENNSNYYTSSSNTYSFVHRTMTNYDPIMEEEPVYSDEVLASITVEQIEEAGSMVWVLASSSMTSAITSSVYDDGKWTIRYDADSANCYDYYNYAIKCEIPVNEIESGTAVGYAIDDANGYDYTCSNAAMYVEAGGLYITLPPKTLVITNVPDISQVGQYPDYESRSIEVWDNDKFSLTISHNWDYGEDTDVWDYSFDGYDNPNVSYEYDDTANTITITGDWDMYDGEGGGEYTLYMKCSDDCKGYDDENYVAGEAQLHFTGLSETIVFDEGTPETYYDCLCDREGGHFDYDNNVCRHECLMVMEFNNIPQDGQVHTIEFGATGDTFECVLDVDMSDGTYNYTDDQSGDYWTVDVDDSDIANGNIKWRVQGYMYGPCYIDYDGNSLLTTPTFDGSSMWNGVSYDVSDGTESSVSGSPIDEYWCIDGGGQYNPQTGECEYPM